MPLLPNILEQGLTRLDAQDGPNPKNARETAQAWFDVWWAYAQGMTYLIPGGGGRFLVEESFKGILMAGLAPSPVPLTFLMSLGGAMAAAWVTLGTPVTLLPGIITLIPQPIPFGPLGLAVVPVGLASSQKGPPRAMLAGLIHGWTITAQAVTPAGPIGPIL